MSSKNKKLIELGLDDLDLLEKRSGKKKFKQPVGAIIGPGAGADNFKRKNNGKVRIQLPNGRKTWVTVSDGKRHNQGLRMNQFDGRIEAQRGRKLQEGSTVKYSKESGLFSKKP